MVVTEHGPGRCVAVGRVPDVSPHGPGAGAIPARTPLIGELENETLHALGEPICSLSAKIEP